VCLRQTQSPIVLQCGGEKKNEEPSSISSQEFRGKFTNISERYLNHTPSPEPNLRRRYLASVCNDRLLEE
jgi:hypothetical protein